MKKLFAVLLALVMSLSLYSCGKEKSRTEDILDGDKVVGKSYYENGQLVKEEYTDENGSVSEYKQYTDGTLSQTGKNEYGDDGDLASSSVSDYDGDRVVKEENTYYKDGEVAQVRTVEYTYNEDGSVLESVSSDGKKTSEVLKNSDGEKLYSTSYDENGSVKTSYENGNISKSETFGTEGELLGYSQMEYGEDGKTSGSVTYNGNGEAVMKTVYEYNGDKVSKIYMYNADGTLFQTGVYGEDGKLTLYDKNGNPAVK